MNFIEEIVICNYCAEHGYIEDTYTGQRSTCPNCNGRRRWKRLYPCSSAAMPRPPPLPRPTDACPAVRQVGAIHGNASQRARESG